MSNVESSATPGSPARDAIEGFLGRMWWVVLLRGILLLLLGIVAFLHPAEFGIAFVQVLGIFIIADGILAITLGVTGEVDSRGWAIARGVIGVLAGLFVVVYSFVVAAVGIVFLMILLAISLIASGTMEIIVAIQHRKEIEGEAWMILGGVLSILLGLLLGLAPLQTGLITVQVVGIFNVIAGISLIVWAFRLKGLGSGGASAA